MAADALKETVFGEGLSRDARTGDHASVTGSQSKAKGRNGEREVAELLTAAGFDAIRNERNSGGGEDVTHEIPGIFIEVCRAERMNLASKFQQAVTASKRVGEGRTPWLIHRSNRRPWVVTMLLEDALSLIPRSSD